VLTDLVLLHSVDTLYTKVLVCPCSFSFGDSPKNLRCFVVFDDETDDGVGDDSHLEGNLHMARYDDHYDPQSCMHGCNP